MSILIWENGVTNSPNIRQNEKYSPKYSKTQQDTNRYKVHFQKSWNAVIARVSEDTIKHKYIKTNMIFGLGNNPMVGATVACAVAVAEAL